MSLPPEMALKPSLLPGLPTNPTHSPDPPLDMEAPEHPGVPEQEAGEPEEEAAAAAEADGGAPGDAGQLDGMQGLPWVDFAALGPNAGFDLPQLLAGELAVQPPAGINLL